MDMNGWSSKRLILFVGLSLLIFLLVGCREDATINIMDGTIYPTFTPAFAYITQCYGIHELKGQVVDQVGRPVADATLILKKSDRLIDRWACVGSFDTLDEITFYTDQNGRFNQQVRLHELDIFEITVKANGYEVFHQENLKFSIFEMVRETFEHMPSEDDRPPSIIIDEDDDRASYVEMEVPSRSWIVPNTSFWKITLQSAN